MGDNEMDLIWGIEQMERELSKTHSPASNIMNICTEVLKQVNLLKLNEVEHIVQIQNPKTKKWVKVNRETGIILDHSQTEKPFDNTVIVKC